MKKFSILALILALAATGVMLRLLIWDSGEKVMEEILQEASTYTVFSLKGIYSSVGTRAEIDALVEKTASSGFNLIIWFVNPRRGSEGVTAQYKTDFFPCSNACEEDLLAYLIERAHEKKLKVWAWFGFMGYKSLLERHPDWAAVWPTGETTLERPCAPSGEKFYVLNPANRDVVEFWKQALIDLVARYEVDGVNFEDDYGFGYCGENFSFDEINRENFTRFLIQRGIENLDWPHDVLEGGKYYKFWVEYKCSLVRNVTGELVEAVKKVKPGIEVSLATSVSLEWSKRAFGIDWIDLEVFDYFTFMAYTADEQVLKSWVSNIFALMRGLKTKPIIIIGWELRGRPALEWVKQALTVRRLGGEDLIIFWDGGLDSSNAWNYFRALFSSMKKN
ncbi:MAG: family 10 glycosylhydrolase [Thermofilaceae archaeon]